jgi:hypothetical protein
MCYNEGRCWRKCGRSNLVARDHRGSIRIGINRAERRTSSIRKNVALQLLDEFKCSHSVGYITRLMAEQLVVECMGMRNRYTMAHESPVEEHCYHDEASGRTYPVKVEGHGEKETITAMNGDVDIHMFGPSVWVSTTLWHGGVIYRYVQVYE